MGAFVARRLLALIPMLFIISVVIFGVSTLVPGDPVMLYLGQESEVHYAPSQEIIDATRKELGLNGPVYLQYVNWLNRLSHGNLGKSIQTRRSVGSMLAEAAPKTAYLAFLSMLIGIMVGVPTGIISAFKRNSPLDMVATLLATMGVAVPHFFMAIMLILLMGVHLGLLPTFGYADPLKDPVGNLRFMALPGLTLGLGLSAAIMRHMRSSMLNVLTTDYVRTARAKGLAERVVLVRHAMRNGLVPVLTVMGLQITALMSGVVIIETVFAIPGLGRLAVTAVIAKDFNVVLGATVLIVCVVVLVNLVVDVSYSLVDPRIRYE